MINLDNASTTKPFYEVINAISDALSYDYLNMSAKYAQAKMVEKKVSIIRENILKVLNAKGNIVFTPSATAANNLVFNSINPKTKQTILVGAGEHSSVYECAKNLQNLGVCVKFIPLCATGEVDFNEFKNLMTQDVKFVSVLHVSNETGAINNIKEIASFAKKVNPSCLIHCDGVQAFGKIRVDLTDLNVDFYTISAHKICGPKGIGALYAKNTKTLKPLILGGGQEFDLISGTENFAYISGFYTAIVLKLKTLESDYTKVLKDKNSLISELKANGINFEINGSLNNSSPYILNLSFEGVRGEVLLHALAQKDILVATGSACSSHKRGNRVLENMGKSKTQVDSSIRFSFSPYEKYDFHFIAKTIKEVIDEIKAWQM